MSELRPCPFCGGEAEISQYYYTDEDTPLTVARCEECGATVTETGNAYASELWNRRTVDVDELNRMVERYETLAKVSNVQLMDISILTAKIRKAIYK